MVRPLTHHAKPGDFSKVNTLDFTDPSEIMLFPRSEADYQAFLISQMRLNDELSQNSAPWNDAGLRSFSALAPLLAVTSH